MTPSRPRRTGFDEEPGARRREAFGVEYVRLDLEDGGELYVTRFGHPLLPWIHPERWHAAGLGASGSRLPGGSGTVYRVDAPGGPRGRTPIVVKVSRLAQDLPITVSTEFMDEFGARDHDLSRFNGPFEEVGAVMSLRRSQLGPPGLRIRTKRPLGIYVPAGRHETWRLGRSASRFDEYSAAHDRDQSGREPEVAIRLDIEREYLLLYGWVEGRDAQDLEAEGALTREESRALTRRVVEELRLKGFEMLDAKPRHFVLRRSRKTGRLLRRGGELVYALIDFELLFRVRTGG